MDTHGLFRRILAGIALSLCSLFALDLILVLTDLLPPRHVYGDPELGFCEPAGTGEVRIWQSPHWRFLRSDSGRIVLNERGFRTTRPLHALFADTGRCRIAVLGDSHSDLPYRNDLTHPFVLEAALRREACSSAEVLSAGRGRYSPLQASLFFRREVSKYNPAVIVLNLYTGNDFFDMVRTDDRPSLVEDSSLGYRLVPPTWFQYDDPALRDSYLGRSRVLYVGGRILRATGLDQFVTRLRYLVPLSLKHGGGVREVVSYFRSLSATDEPALPFSRAYGAQVLNQHLFFRFFPQAGARALGRLGFLFHRMREENPGRLLVLSPIPSAALCGALAGDPLYTARLAASGCDAGAVAMAESLLYRAALDSARAAGWVTLDNLPKFRSYPGVSELYMQEDLHLSPVASQLFGEHEASIFISQGILDACCRRGETSAISRPLGRH